MADTPGATPGPSEPGSNTRQKRVLPSRSRRGGPGIGSCDVDLMILDAQKRKLESDPLIPADTQFLLTTNSALVSEPSSSTSPAFGLNVHANQRYFERPEVLKAYRKQQLIQTPEYSLLSEDASVGGRFRPRGSGEELTDTSDAMYEKRHRKYETFEKRQRLREKEKLKHEQYKLKERIEQLKAMHGSAFLGLPASSFSLPPGAAEEVEVDNLPGAHINGAAIYNEGERRREEMLEVAAKLEERYRTLLPSERKGLELKKDSRQSSVNVPSTSDIRPIEESIVNGRASVIDTPPVKPSGSIVLKIKVPQLRQRDFSGIPPSQSGTPVSKSGKHIFSSPSVPFPSEHQQAFSSPYKPTSRASSDTQSTSSIRPRKRPRQSYRDDSPTPERAARPSSSAHATKHEPCVLMLSAIRTSSAPKARKTQRHVTAFGAKVPPEIEEVRDFEIPYWLRRSRSLTAETQPEPSYLAYNPDDKTAIKVAAEATEQTVVATIGTIS
ncbi:hypothetical protein BV22DRAFT_1065347 [Leucogyrophana mollusca]|uniref:Uncharacterized protein n=1 Tax=Leucogyrophana mollusca TaxID=85980 RepID=A0ACB8BII7_9AGAM|nr:hypothetical protein BV22DRAFT_1065347 [Leucogyrophana mollusca]